MAQGRGLPGVSDFSNGEKSTDIDDIRAIQVIH